MYKILTLIVLFLFCLTANLIAQTNQTVSNGASTNAANFPAGCSFTWTNDNPSIGLPASGTGNIAAFTAINTNSAPVIATITATASTGSCATVTFTITVNPSPSITIGPYTVNTIICEGSASDVTQFEVSGSFLTGGVTVSRTGDFIFSSSASGGNLNLQPVNGTLDPTMVYVNTGGGRSGTRTGTISFSSPGMATKSVTISAFVDKLPSANAMPNLRFKAGDRVSDIIFPGTADKYRWTNSIPGIGLPADGLGTHISSFIASNSTDLPLTATVTVIPVNNTACEGSPVYFDITVENDPALSVGTVNGNITACLGSASTTTQQFVVSGRHLKDDVKVLAPSGFEISTTSDRGFSSEVKLIRLNGALSTKIIYVRSAAGAAVGLNSGVVTIYTLGSPDKTVGVSSTVKETPVVNAVTSQYIKAKTYTSPIAFTGTGSQYKWANSNPAIGLASSGIGDIDAFMATNNSNEIITATITVIPINGSGCDGKPESFNIIVDPIQRPIIMVPTAFSPNGDGINDNWVIENATEYPKIRVKVFNRLGVLVFSSQGYPQPWNGKSGNNDLPIGTYYYLIDTNEKKVLSGHMSIIR